jgi:hypothetical protein
VANFIRDAPAKRAPTNCSLPKSDKSPIFRFFHTDCHNTITNALTKALQRVNERKKNIRVANWILSI